MEQEKKNFDLLIRGKKCAGCGKEKAVSFIRNKAVCNKCFNLIKKDNVKLTNSGESIPKDLKVRKVNIFDDDSYIDYRNKQFKSKGGKK